MALLTLLYLPLTDLPFFHSRQYKGVLSFFSRLHFFFKLLLSVCLLWIYVIFAKETKADSTYGSSHTQSGAGPSFVRKIRLEKADGKKEKSHDLNHYPVVCEQPHKGQRNFKKIWVCTEDEFRYCQAQEEKEHRGLLKYSFYHPSLLVCGTNRLLHSAHSSVTLQYTVGLIYGLSVPSYTYIQPRQTTCYSSHLSNPWCFSREKLSALIAALSC